MTFHVLGSIAEFAREPIIDGIGDFRAAARERGRRPALSPERKIEVRRLRDKAGREIAEIAPFVRS